MILRGAVPPGIRGEQAPCTAKVLLLFRRGERAWTCEEVYEALAREPGVTRGRVLRACGKLVKAGEIAHNGVRTFSYRYVSETIATIHPYGPMETG